MKKAQWNDLKELKLCLVIENYFVGITLVGNEKKLIITCICCVAFCGSETGAVGNREMVLNGFETWSWRGML